MGCQSSVRRVHVDEIVGLNQPLSARSARHTDVAVEGATCARRPGRSSGLPSTAPTIGRECRPTVPPGHPRLVWQVHLHVAGRSFRRPTGPPRDTSAQAPSIRRDRSFRSLHPREPRHGQSAVRVGPMPNVDMGSHHRTPETTRIGQRVYVFASQNQRLAGAHTAVVDQLDNETLPRPARCGHPMSSIGKAVRSHAPIETQAPAQRPCRLSPSGWCTSCRFPTVLAST
jgi:hypothetical protein